jgi:hypothetical protein
MSALYQEFMPGYLRFVPPGQRIVFLMLTRMRVRGTTEKGLRRRKRGALHGGRPRICYLLFAIREAPPSPLTLSLFRQHEIADNGAEISTTGDELSKRTPSGAKGIKCLCRQPVFRKRSAEIDEFL